MTMDMLDYGHECDLCGSELVELPAAVCVDCVDKLLTWRPIPDECPPDGLYVCTQKSDAEISLRAFTTKVVMVRSGCLLVPPEHDLRPWVDDLTWLRSWAHRILGPLPDEPEEP